MKLALPLRLLLWPLSMLYGTAARLTAWLYAHVIYTVKHLNAPVISVGNLTVGGTGKTPMVLWLAERCMAEGKRVAVLSRGYRGSGGTSDEVEMLKSKLGERVLYGVGPDRYQEGRRIESEHHIDVFLLDDGFQHLQLARAVDIVLIDSTRPLSKEFLLPAGSRREPMSAISRASVVLYTRVEQAPLVVPAIRKSPSLPTFPASTKLMGFKQIPTRESSPSDHVPQPVFAFCGIGNPEAFFGDLARWNVEVAGKAAFRDHHVYSAREARQLESLAQQAQAKALLTTEKDIQNMGDARFSLPLYCCEIALDIPDAEQLWKLINQFLAAAEARS